MSNLGKLFGGASKIAATPEPTSPEPAAQTSRPAAFKIGGAKPAASPSPAAEQASPSESVAPSASPQSLPDAPPTPAFPDQTPATAPQRELPADVGEAVARFVANLDHLHTLTPEPDLASAAISNIMIELRSNPQYIEHIMPEDVRVIIQMQRETMALAKITKEKKVSKRKGGSKAGVQQAIKDLEEMFGDL